MQEQLDSLQRQIDDLKSQLTDQSMPIELRSIMQNSVVKDAVTGTQTQTVTVSALGQVVTIPTITQTFLIIKWKGKEYKIPYYV